MFVVPACATMVATFINDTFEYKDIYMYACFYTYILICMYVFVYMFDTDQLF
jgi:hypothetical protein